MYVTIYQGASVHARCHLVVSNISQPHARQAPLAM